MKALIALLTLAVTVLTAPAYGQPPTVTEAWVRATPPGARTAAAYLTIVATTDDRLLGASSTAGAVELHAQTVDNGLHGMRALAEIALPEDTPVRLEPGGLHLMLLDLAAPLVPGEVIAFTLRFAVAGNVAIAAPVVDARAMTPASH